MFRKIFSNHDIYLTGLVISLLLIGLITLFSTTRGTGLDNEVLFNKQLIFVISGLVFYFFISFVDLNILKSNKFQIFLYVFLIIILIAVLLFTAKVKGASRWFVLPLPFVGSINLQPADLAKVISVTFGAYILTNFQRLFPKNIRSLNFLNIHRFIPYLIFMTPILGLILIQPALGTTLIITFSLIFMYYFSAKSKVNIVSYLLIIVLSIFTWLFLKNNDIFIRVIIAIIVNIIISFFFFPKQNKYIFVVILLLSNLFLFFITKPNIVSVLGEYQQDRVECWLSPEKDPTGICFQQIQAKIAIGSGQLFGRGFSQGLQVQRERLPEFQNDFIYAAFAEQYGFLGTIVLLVVFFLFIVEIFRLSTSKKSEFSRIIILTIGVMFLLQIFINISMNTGLLPTTGISLPFMSYGGSFMWIALIAVGLVQNLSHHNILADNEDTKYSRWDEED